VSRQSPKGPRAGRSRPIKRRHPRGLGKGRITKLTTRYVEPTIKPQPPMTDAEWAHLISTLHRRLPLS
jgi:hypothetical protein